MKNRMEKGLPAGGRRLERAEVLRKLPNSMFLLRKEDGTEVTAHVAGTGRMQFTRLLPGDLVEIEKSPFDPSKARIAALRRSTIAPTENDQPTEPPANESEP
ncbi:MAG: hypothetical protein Fur0037_07380 [Planctomycetota bacterium]